MPRKSTYPLLPRILTVLSLLLTACAQSLPPLEEQKARVRNGQFPFQMMTSRAILDAWGPPTYGHQEYTQFFGLQDGTYVPFFRVSLGEAPPGWDNSVVPGHAQFLAYADRGELLGFLEDRLVYREQMSAEQIHAIGTMWEKEARFKTQMDKASPPPP
jgi:hypothetical protein